MKQGTQRSFIWPGTGEKFAEGDLVWCTGEPNNRGQARREACTVVAGNRPSKKNGKPCLDDRECLQKKDATSNTLLAAICEVEEDC